jgi:hypothetical protein
VTDWLLTSLATTLLLGSLAFLCRNFILTRLKASVQHEFNEKLERVRADLSKSEETFKADLRKSEEAFKADLRAKEAQIDVLRSGALSGMASRQALFDQRRLQAIEQLWDGFENLAFFKTACSIMATVDFKKSLKQAAQDPKARELFSQVGKNVALEDWPKTDAHKARPFVSEIAWALFSAYQAILGHAATQIHMLKVGLNQPQLLDEPHVPKLIKAALPWCGEYIDQVGSAGYYNILEPLEAELLKEMRRMMHGEDSDESTVQRAARIMEEVRKVQEATSKGSLPSTSPQVEVPQSSRQPAE